MDCLFIAKEKEKIFQCYTEAQIGDSPVVSHEEFYENSDEYKEIRFIFSTWGMIVLSEAEIKEKFPKLQAVFYGAGSVKYFAEPFLQCGVRVFSSWMANAVPVAEFLVGQILLANKGYFLMHNRYKEEGFQASRGYCRKFTGNYTAKVGFLGCGSITQLTIQLLKPYHLDLYVYSKHLTEVEAKELRVQKAEMDWIFENCQTISNNMANTSETVGILDYEKLSKIGEFATFINTGRGAQVNLEDLKRVFRAKRDCVALIDVTDPEEPLLEENDIWEIPNIFISPHSAGSISKEIFRMGDYMMETYEKFLSGGEVSYEVTAEMLETMA